MIRSGRNAVIDSAVEINNGIDVVAIQNPLQGEAPGPLATSRWGYGILASSAKTPWVLLQRMNTKAEKLARPEGIEPPTLCLEGRCSIRLSYGRVSINSTT